MRKFTICLIVIFICELLTCLPGYAAMDMTWGGTTGTFEKIVQGTSLEARIDIFPVLTRDANLRATSWNFNEPEASWASSVGTYPEPTNRDYFRFYVDIPGMIRNIKEVGLTTDQNGTTTYKAKHIPNKGYAIDFAPGSLPTGAINLSPYVMHENDRGGITILIFTIQWMKEGQIASGFHINVRRAPEDFDEFFPNFRRKFRAGFRDVDAELLLSEEDQKQVAAYRKQRDAEREVRRAEEERRTMISSGQFCSTCFTARNEYIYHPDGVCPALHPGEGQTVPFVPAPAAASPPPPPRPPVVTPSSRPTQSSVRRPSLPSRAGTSVPMTYFVYRDWVATGQVVIPMTERHEQNFKIMVGPGASRSRYTINYPAGNQWSSPESTDRERTIVFSKFNPGRYLLTVQEQSSQTGQWIQSSRIIVVIQ